ncbi:MAG: phosphoribosylglycinamide formyltransferase [Ginsengibacter sp.]
MNSGLSEIKNKNIPLRQNPKGKQRKRIAIFASGAGSNTQKIIDHFKESKTVETALIICNNPKAGVISIASKERIPVLYIEKNKFAETGYIKEIKDYAIDFIILAGFLWKVPLSLIHSFPKKIINIHPALLPDFGGKGMYGHAVHAAVITAGKQESGITIHYVDEKYDHGTIIFQARCKVEKEETPDSLAQKIHLLEHTFYPQKIEDILKHFE